MTEPGRATAAAPERDFGEEVLVPELASFPEGETKSVQLGAADSGFATIAPGTCLKTYTSNNKKATMPSDVKRRIPRLGRFSSNRSPLVGFLSIAGFAPFLRIRGLIQYEFCRSDAHRTMRRYVAKGRSQRMLRITGKALPSGKCRNSTVEKSSTRVLPCL